MISGQRPEGGGRPGGSPKARHYGQKTKFLSPLFFWPFRLPFGGRVCIVVCKCETPPRLNFKVVMCFDGNYIPPKNPTHTIQYIFIYKRQSNSEIQYKNCTKIYDHDVSCPAYFGFAHSGFFFCFVVAVSHHINPIKKKKCLFPMCINEHRLAHLSI